MVTNTFQVGSMSYVNYYEDFETAEKLFKETIIVDIVDYGVMFTPDDYESDIFPKRADQILMWSAKGNPYTEFNVAEWATMDNALAGKEYKDARVKYTVLSYGTSNNRRNFQTVVQGDFTRQFKLLVSNSEVTYVDAFVSCDINATYANSHEDLIMYYSKYPCIWDEVAQNKKYKYNENH